MEYEFGSSFDETTCEKYIKSTKKKSRGMCKGCGFTKAHHLLWVVDNVEDAGGAEEGKEESDSMILLADLFCNLRNLRISVTNFFGWSGNEINTMLPHLISVLTDGLFAIEDVTDIMDMDQLIEAGQELVGYFEPSAEGDNMIE